jgi:MFS family permease
MVGIGENYLPAFVLVLTASQLACGLAATVPMVCGAVLQLASPYAVRRLHSYRAWVVLCAVVQAIAFLPLLGASLVGAMPVLWVFAFASIYWGTGLAAGPSWNVWVGTLVPERLRATYFARRTLVCQAGTLAGLLIGGLALQAGSELGLPLAMFAVLFSVAIGSRLVSARYLANQREPSPPRQDTCGQGIGRVLKSLREDTNPRVLLYVLGMQIAVQMSGPYFNPYMFVQLKLSYWGYVILTCAAYVAKIAALPLLGQVTQRWGANRVLWVSGLGIIPLPALWLLHHNLGYLIVVQVLSGVAWAGYELAMLLLFFETIPASKRVSILTVFNLANSTAYLAGSLIGGAVLAGLGAGPRAYAVLFAASSLARVAALLLLLRIPKFALRDLLADMRSAVLRPRVAPTGRPALPSLATVRSAGILSGQVAAAAAGAAIVSVAIVKVDGPHLSVPTPLATADRPSPAALASAG